MTENNSIPNDKDREVDGHRAEEEQEVHIEEIIQRDEVELIALTEMADEKREEIRQLKEEQHGQGHHHIEEINVNTRPTPYCEKEITFRKVVVLAYPDAIFNGRFTYTVEYSKGPTENPKGSLTDNKQVYVKNKMVFDVERGDVS